MNRIIARKQNSTLEYECDCGKGCQVEYMPRRQGTNVLKMRVQHCQRGQRQQIGGEIVALRERRDDDWVQVSYFTD